MQIAVHCRCDVQRTIDTDRVGPWRLRCKGCGDIIYDPQAAAAPPPPPPSAASPEEDTQFHEWLQGSAELKVMMSSEGDPGFPSQSCRVHPAYKIVAACSRCEKLLCKRCLDRVGDAFTCGSCIEAQLLSSREQEAGGIAGFFRRLFGKRR